MIPAWQAFLQGRGAVYDGQSLAHFGQPAVELDAAAHGSILADLSHFGLLAVTGEDAATFMQGQFSNDVRAVSPTQAQYSSLNTPKGRMLASFLLCQRAADYALCLPAVLVEPIRKRLAMFVLRSKVALADASDASVRLGLAGPAAEGALGTLFGALPETHLGVTQQEDMTLMRLGQARFLLTLPPETAPALWEKLSTSLTPVGHPAWDWLTLQAGIPTVYPETQEEFVPQMVNFEVIGGISFRKGCYTGQEIIARAQHLGKVKRRMRLAHAPEGPLPRPGAQLSHPDEEGVPGRVVDAQLAPGGGFDMLVVVPESCRETRLEGGAALEWRDLPYSLESAD